MLNRGVVICLLLVVGCSVHAEDYSGLLKNSWLQVDTQHFRIIGNVKAKKLKVIAQNLENFRYASGLIMGKPPAKHIHLTVFLLKDQGDLSLLYPGDASSSNVAGFYQRSQSTNYAVVNSGIYNRRLKKGGNSQVMGTIYHEYSHSLMANSSGDLYFPSWYSEGYAEFLATLQIIDQSTFKIGGVAEGRASQMDYYDWQDFADLIKQKNGLEMDGYYDSYALSWLAVHYLHTHPQYSNNIIPYLVAINRGEDEAVAFKRVFGITPEKFSTVLKKYFRKKEYPNITHKLKSPMPDVELALVKLTRRQIVDHLAERILNTGANKEEFSQLLNAAGEDDDTVHLLARQVEMAFNDSDWPRADELLQKMVASYPDHQQTYLQMAHVDYAKATSDPQMHHFENRKELLEDTKRSLVEILSKDRSNVHALFDLGLTTEAINPDDEMVGKLYETARYYNNRDDNIAVTLVLYYQRNDRNAEALDLLRQVARGTERGSINKNLLALMDELEEKVNAQGGSLAGQDE
jgi:hypothetical protein